jgi:hypothetical protein
MPDSSSPQISLAEAFSKAQGQFRTPTLNRNAKIKNAQGVLLYETNYADLQECIDCVKKPLADNGLSFTQTIDFIHTPREMWVLKLTIRHSGGEAIDSVLPLTYFKRYQFTAFFGLAADFDDDGNAAENKGQIVDAKGGPKPRVATPSPKPSPAPASSSANSAPKMVGVLSQAQLDRLWKKASVAQWTDDEVKRVLVGCFNLEGFEQMTRIQYDEFCAILDKRINPNEAFNEAVTVRA